MTDACERSPRPAGHLLRLLVAAAVCLVHAPGPDASARAQGAASKAKAPVALERAFHGALPPNVVEMRELLLAAVHSGKIEDLREAIDWSASPPDFGAPAASDAIAHLKSISTDGEGRSVLAMLANMLSLPPARLALGRDPENTMVFVWPYLAELPPDTLKPGEEVDLRRLMPEPAIRAMREAKKWTWWRLAIGADGTWHAFRTYD